MDLIETIDERAVLGVRTTLLRATSNSQIAVSKREDRLQLSEEFRMEAPLDHIPFVGRVVARWWPERFVADHFTVPPYRERLSSDRVLCCRTVRFRRRSSSFGANWDCGKIASAIRGSASLVRLRCRRGGGGNWRWRNL